MPLGPIRMQLQSFLASLDSEESSEDESTTDESTKSGDGQSVRVWGLGFGV